MKYFTVATESVGIGFSIHIRQTNKNLDAINICPY